jgi:hypothetical protein
MRALSLELADTAALAVSERGADAGLALLTSGIFKLVGATNFCSI